MAWSWLYDDLFDNIQQIQLLYVHSEGILKPDKFPFGSDSVCMDY